MQWLPPTLRRGMQVLVAGGLERVAPLRWALYVAVRIFAPRQRIGVLAVVERDDGALLLGRHVFRPGSPWGLLGGWLHRGEAPDAAIARELREELGVDAVRVGPLVLAALEAYPGEPDSITLFYRCRVEAGLPAEARPAFEIRDLRWVTRAEARGLLRPSDQRGVDAAVDNVWDDWISPATSRPRAADDRSRSSPGPERMAAAYCDMRARDREYP